MWKKIVMVLALLVEAAALIAYYEQTPQPKPTPQTVQKRDTGVGLFPQPPVPPPASGTARATPKP
jgi:hypothetical protein